MPKNQDTKAPETMPVEEPKRKLLFVPSLLDVDRQGRTRRWHVTGRTSPALEFKPNGDDPIDDRPHAIVRVSLGEHLIAHDRDDTNERRYRWAD